MAICQESHGSCSACCGLFNLELSEKERKKWLDRSTEKFLQLDLTDSMSVYRYRLSVEPGLRSKSILKDVYVCPFVGWVDIDKTKTGCLLHPVGSPDPTTKNLDHPQSHSFYGETICQNYNCVSKSKELAFPEDISEQTKTDPFLYGRLVSNHNLLSVMRVITKDEKYPIGHLLPIVLTFVKKYPVPVTSFEMALTLGFYTPDQLWHVLGTLFDRNSYGKNAFVLTEQGQKIGEIIRLEAEKT